MSDDLQPGRGGNFPQTRQSLLQAVRSGIADERQRALDLLIAAYWKPVYKYIRLRWDKDNEQAQDLTQDFFARLLERDFFLKYDPARARLRTFLRVCVDGLVANHDKAALRLKRGGGAPTLSLDFDAAESELRRSEPRDPAQPDDFFTREWARSLLTLALERLRREFASRGKTTHFQLLELYDIEEGGRDLTYEQVAERFSLKPTDVTNYLAFARREFRRIVLDQLREMTASDEEFRREARSLLGVDIP
jgi:RNA polymerase sigma factor (sigma-70 family)